MNRPPQKNHIPSASASVDFEGHTYNIPAEAAIGTVWPCSCCPPGQKVKVIQWIDGELAPYGDIPSDFGLLIEDGDGGSAAQNGLVQLARGESRTFRFVAEDANALLALVPSRRFALHWWFGRASIACPEYTEQGLLPQAERVRRCPLCALGDDLPDRAKLAIQWHLPVLEQAREKKGKARTPSAGVRFLRVNPRTYTNLREAVISLDNKEINPCALVWRIQRRDDEFGSYLLEPTDETCEPVTSEYALPALPLHLEDERELQKFAETLRVSRQIEPEPGRAEKWRKVFKGAPLIACDSGQEETARLRLYGRRAGA